MTTALAASCRLHDRVVRAKELSLAAVLSAVSPSNKDAAYSDECYVSTSSVSLDHLTVN